MEAPAEILELSEKKIKSIIGNPEKSAEAVHGELVNFSAAVHLVTQQPRIGQIAAKRMEDGSQGVCTGNAGIGCGRIAQR